MKANKKARENYGVSPVVGTLLMMPVVLMIMTFMIMWGNDLVDKLKKFQDMLNDMAKQVKDLDKDLRILGKNKNIVWQDNFEDVRLDNYDFKNVWHGFGTGSCQEDTSTSYSPIHSKKIIANSNNYKGIEKYFGGRSSANKIAVELAFTMDSSGYEDYKQITIKETDTTGDDMNIGIIQIYANGDLYYIDAIDRTDPANPVLNQVLIHDVGDLLADELGWHTMKLVVDFGHTKTYDPQYVSLTLNGEVFNIEHDLVDSTFVTKDEPISLCVQIESHANNLGDATSYIDNFVLRDYELSGYENQEPLTPEKPLASPTNIVVGGVVTFTVVTTDPEEDMIFYQFDWEKGGVHDYSAWYQGYQSGEKAKIDHTFMSDGTYNVRVRARDTEDNYTPWSDPVTITVTVT